MGHEQGSQGLGLHRVHRAVSLEDAESIAEDESVADAVADDGLLLYLLLLMNFCSFFYHNIAHYTRFSHPSISKRLAGLSSNDHR